MAQSDPITLTIPAGHIRKIKQALRKSGAQVVTLKHDPESGTTTFGGTKKGDKSMLVGGRVEAEAKLRYTKKPAGRKDAEAASDESEDTGSDE